VAHPFRLERLAGVDVVAACENGMVAVAKIPAPVQMPEMTGYDVIEAIGVDGLS